MGAFTYIVESGVIAEGGSFTYITEGGSFTFIAKGGVIAEGGVIHIHGRG